jgi:hypothetical protein
MVISDVSVKRVISLFLYFKYHLLNFYHLLTFLFYLRFKSNEQSSNVYTQLQRQAISCG